MFAELKLHLLMFDVTQ